MRIHVACRAVADCGLLELAQQVQDGAEQRRQEQEGHPGHHRAGEAGADATADRVVPVGYAKGVPMGGDLPSARPGQVPEFLIAAMKDPQGANLDRVQVVKGWVDSSGKTHEKIYNVAWSDAERFTYTSVGGVQPPDHTVEAIELGVRHQQQAHVVLAGVLLEPRVIAHRFDEVPAVRLHQISEIIPVKGVTLVGPLPAEIQNYTTYAAAVGTEAKQAEAARALIKLLTGPSADSVLKARGMERPPS